MHRGYIASPECIAIEVAGIFIAAPDALLGGVGERADLPDEN